MRRQHGVEYDYGVLVTFFDFVFFSLPKKNKRHMHRWCWFWLRCYVFFFCCFYPFRSTAVSSEVASHIYLVIIWLFPYCATKKRGKEEKQNRIGTPHDDGAALLSHGKRVGRTAVACSMPSAGKQLGCCPWANNTCFFFKGLHISIKSNSWKEREPDAPLTIHAALHVLAELFFFSCFLRIHGLSFFFSPFPLVMSQN